MDASPTDGSDRIPSGYEKTMHIIKSNTDKEECCISSICEATDNKLFILDWRNKKVKLLDHTYHVVHEIELDGQPYSMCSIDSNQVAVSAVETFVERNEKGTVKGTEYCNKIYFITHTPSLVRNSELSIKYECRGIAHHKGKLYITSGTALYSCRQWKDRAQWQKLYEDTKPVGATVTSCAVSKDGDRVYWVNQRDNTLVTLDTQNGKVSILHGLPGNFNWGYKNIKAMQLHATATGDILMSGGKIDAILMIDRDGKNIFQKLNTKEDGVCKPRSVFYSENTRSVIVGVWKNDIFFVYPSAIFSF